MSDREIDREWSLHPEITREQAHLRVLARRQAEREGEIRRATIRQLAR